MKHRIYLLCLFTVISICAKAQTAGAKLFSGTIDGKIQITLFLHAQQHPCEDKTIYEGIYSYNKTKGTNKWLLLNIDYNEAKQFIMVEERFSGVMILKKEDKGFSGIWIHPDGVTQRKVVLTQQQVTEEVLEKYQEYLDETNHLYHDC